MDHECQILFCRTGKCVSTCTALVCKEHLATQLLRTGGAGFPAMEGTVAGVGRPWVGLGVRSWAGGFCVDLPSAFRLLLPSRSGRPGLSWRKGRVQENFLWGVWGRAPGRGTRQQMAAEL